jgi:hypothetical protein
MKINQLFRKRVDVATLLATMKCFGLTGLSDRRSFCKGDLAEFGTVEKLRNMISELEEFYMPCKTKVYLRDLTEKRSVTVLKQILRIHGYFLVSSERNFNNRKIIFYSLMSELDVNSTPKMHRFEQTRVIDFN